MIDLARDFPFLRKKLTVSGIMGQTQGVSNATNPPIKQVKKMYHTFDVSTESACCSVKLTGSQRGPLIFDWSHDEALDL